MSDNYLSNEIFCMRSEIVDHDRKLEWIISGISKFQMSDPFNTVTSKTFKLAPKCIFDWELEITLFRKSIVLNIRRKDNRGERARLSRSVLLQNSEGETYDPPMPDVRALAIGNSTTTELLQCELTKVFPLKLPNDELTVKIHLKLSKCCVITDEIKDPKVSRESGLSRDLLRGCLLQSKHLDMQPSDIWLETGEIILPCHKFILSLRSTFFKKVLDDGMLEGIGSVKLDDMDLEVAQGFMAYIYTNEINAVHPDAVRELYDLGVKYQVHDLQDKCRLILAESLSENNVIAVVQLAALHSDLMLQMASTKFLKELSTKD